MTNDLLPSTQTAVSDDELTRPVFAFLDAVNRGDLDAAVAQLTPDALHHGRISNYRAEGVKVLFNMMHEVFPDLRFAIEDIRVEGSRVISRVVGTGTHTGTYLGKPPTGKVVVFESVDIAIIAPVDVVEVETEFEADANPFRRIGERFWDLVNDPELWESLGFVPGIMC